jgi:hypothetical protein
MCRLAMVARLVIAGIGASMVGMALAILACTATAKARPDESLRAVGAGFR